MKNTILWILRLVVAGILLQTLYFKFTAHPDSVYIFEQTGLGAPGRIGIGVIELIAAVLVLIPRFTHFGAALTVGVISGAIFFHLTKLGINVNDDGGTLFYMAVTVFLGALALLYFYKDQITKLLSR